MKFNLSKTKIRILFWGGFLLFMITVVMPFFFFFYLFNEEQVKQTIINQFDNKIYNVEIDGMVVPKLWHGMSLDLSGIILTTKNDAQVLKIHNMSCKLSWLNLILGRYRVNRISINGLDVHEENLLQNGLNNLLNISTKNNLLFSNIEVVDIYGVDSVGKAIYPVNDGTLKIEQDGIGAVFNLGFKLLNGKTYFVLDGSVASTDGSTLKFDELNARIYNTFTNINIGAKATYHLGGKNFELNNLLGNIQFNNYVGNLSIENVDIDYTGLIVNNAVFQVDFSKNLITNHVLMNINKLDYTNFESVVVNKLLVQYTANVPGVKFGMDSTIKNLTYMESAGVYSKECASQINFSSPSLKNNALNAILNGSCAYNLSGNTMHFILDGNLNNSPLNLDLKIQNTKPKPYVVVNGNISNLDLSRVDLDKNKINPLFDDTDKLPFGWLSLFDAEANLSINSFALDRIALNNVITKFSIKNNELDVSKLNASVYDGTLAGSVQVTQKNNVYDISTKQVIKNINLKSMLSDLFDINAISGTTNLMLTSNANNVDTYDDIHKKINGAIVLEAKNGAFQGVDFNLFVNQESELNLSNSKSTIFNSMLAKFNFVNGVSRDGSLEFSSPYVIANGIGTLDFITNTLNYNLFIKSALPKNEQKISSVLIPVVVNGDILNPKINIQNVKLIGESTKSKTTSKFSNKNIKKEHHNLKSHKK